MCYNVKKITNEGKRKKTNYAGKEGEKYDTSSWQKCGKCIECMNEKSNNWVIRNYFEAKKYDEKMISFITLTYEKSTIILQKNDLQKFIKRLRKEQPQIRYFAVGEYGKRTNRPHFHLILYNYKRGKIKLLEVNKKNNAVFQDETIEQKWGNGRTSLQNFQQNEIGYITLYNSINSNANSAFIEIPNTIVDKGLIAEMKRWRKTKKLADGQKYKAVKEFNMWSQSLGWSEFIKKDYSETWKVHIGNGEFMIPTDWIKRLAESGDTNAITELKERQIFSKKREESTRIRKYEKEQQEVSTKQRKDKTLSTQIQVI